MIEDEVLYGLLLVSVVLALLLVLVGMALATRSLLDIEYQSARGITGIPRIQAEVNLRGHASRAALGLLFIVINVLLLAGAPEPYRMWTNRLGWTLLLAGTVVASALDWCAARQQVLLVEKSAVLETVSRHTAEAESIDSYRQMAAEAIHNLEMSVASRPEGELSRAVPPLAPVIPEHSSPTTDRQRRTADVATMRARLVAANLALGIEPAPSPPEQETQEP